MVEKSKVSFDKIFDALKRTQGKYMSGKNKLILTFSYSFNL